MLSEEVMKEFSNREVILHCPTKETYMETMTLLEELGYKWQATGNLPSKSDVWSYYESNTFVRIGTRGGLVYGNIKCRDDFNHKPKVITIGKYHNISNSLEAQQDLETLRSLFKKYHVCFAGNLEETIEKAAKKEMGNI